MVRDVRQLDQMEIIRVALRLLPGHATFKQQIE